MPFRSFRYNSRRNKKLLMSAVLAFAFCGLLLAVFFCNGCAVIHGTAGQPSRQPTSIEQILTWNAAIADANLSIAKGVIAANEANEIDVPTSNAILTQQSRIADADRQLTPILSKACSPQATIQSCNPTILSGDATQIQSLLDQIKQSAASLVATGTAGIKNPQKAQTVKQAIQTISTFAADITQSLQSLNVLH